jgi:diaminohydroxyphosphoribosylaminopyrimidine deaminase/5-amino-6-(5-phosphoribosylamino)uracil reductase
MTQDEKYIRRCIQLAQNGLCTTAPNPMVGAVIVYNDRIIGEGYHIRSGEGHAEVNAIRSVKDESLLSKATIYVSLEPCSHYGKTPPCADLIISKRIPRVVIGCVDPFPLVAGRGIRKLQEAGISVTVGILEQECKELIRRFTTYNLKKRPYITLKWAESADGFIDIIRQDGKPVILSTPLTALHAHKLRAENQAILVGRKTALLDNPSLSTRHWYGRHPLRLVIDKDLSLPSGLHLFDGSLPTVVFTSRQKESSNNLEYRQLDFTQDILPQIMQVLYEKKIQTLLVEGGSQLLQSFLSSGLWDEAYVEHSRTVLKEGVAAPSISPQYGRKEFQYDGVRMNYYVK